MALLLSILKIVGTIILYILIVLLILLLYILFCPFWYNAGGSNSEEEGFKYSFNIYDFIKFWNFKFEAEELTISAFWGLLRVFPWGKKNKPSDDLELEPDSDEDELYERAKAINAAREENTAKRQDDCNTEESMAEESIAKESMAKESDADKNQEEQNQDEQDQDEQDQDEKIKRVHKKDSFVSNIKNITDLLDDEAQMSAIKFILKQALWLLKKVKPNIVQADIDFCLDDPAYTGIATGIISLFPVIYADQVSIRPDFESDRIYVVGFAQIKGFIFSIDVIYVIIRIVLNKDCRNLFK